MASTLFTPCKFYLAAPVITSEKIKQEVGNVWQALADTFTVHNVYRPGFHKVPNEWGITMEMWGQCVFTMDVLAIDESDWVVLCNYGRTGGTAGTAWECGYAFAKQKRILVINMPGVNESSLMVRGCASNVVDYRDFVESSDVSKFFIERGKLARTETLS